MQTESHSAPTPSERVTGRLAVRLALQAVVVTSDKAITSTGEATGSKSRPHKETVGGLYERAWDEQVAPRYRSGEPTPGMSRERFLRLLDAAEYWPRISMRPPSGLSLA